MSRAFRDMGLSCGRMTDMLDPDEPTFRKSRNEGHPQSPRCRRKFTSLPILSLVETWANRNFAFRSVINHGAHISFPCSYLDDPFDQRLRRVGLLGDRPSDRLVICLFYRRT